MADVKIDVPTTKKPASGKPEDNNKTSEKSEDHDDMCTNIDTIDKLEKNIQNNKRRLDIYRKILELKYNRYKKCHNFWGISTIFFSTSLTLIESCKLILRGGDGDDYILGNNFFDLTPVIIGSIITFSSAVVKFKKYQEKMEIFNNMIEKCVGMMARLKNQKEIINLKPNMPQDEFKILVNNYKDEILKDFLIIYQESQKCIKSSDYDKYLKILNYSEINKHILEHERILFYEKYRPTIDINDMKEKASKCYRIQNCCC